MGGGREGEGLETIRSKEVERCRRIEGGREGEYELG